jgi:hypothetical protein
VDLCAQASGGDDGVAGDGGGGDGAAHGAPGRQRAGLLRALPGYLLPPHLSGSLMSSKLVLGTRAESSHHLMSSL